MQLQVNGDSVYVNTGGVELDADKPSVVFIHGAAMDHSAWVLYARYLARHGCNALSIDLPGHGRSGGALLTSVEAMADWLPALLDAAGIARAALVGHSMGSLVALECAARHADRISRIALLGCAFPMPVAEPLLAAARANQQAAVDMVTLFGHGYAAQLGGNPVAGVNIQNLGMRLLEQAGDGVMYTGLSACNAYAGGLDAAAKVRCPVALIIGDSDQMTPPRAARELAAALSAAGVEVHVETLHDCGHMMMSEQPEMLHRALLVALRGL